MVRIEKLANETASWFENELMKNSESEISMIENSEELEIKDFERRGAIVNFCLEIEREVKKALKNGELISLSYREEEGNLIKTIAEKADLRPEWIPKATVIVGEGSGMTVYR